MKCIDISSISPAFLRSEAQTLPYSPDYQIGSQVPEVLQLTHLTYGSGLPATESELQIIERTRQKRLFKQMLPPPCDERGPRADSLYDSLYGI